MNRLPFQYFWRHLAQRGVVLGDERKGSSMTVTGDCNKSLPSYHNIYLGKDSFCKTNTCPPPKDKTFLDIWQQEQNLQDSEIAIFSSWNMIKRSISHIPGSFTSSIGPEIFATKNPIFVKINENIIRHPSKWPQVRPDQYTWELALTYLKNYQPRFLAIHLGESDEWAHENNYPLYIKALKSYDEKLKELDDILKTMPNYAKNTIIIMTTDHSRGNGSEWTSHHAGNTRPEHFIWTYVMGGPIKPLSSIYHQEVPSHNITKQIIFYLHGIPTEISYPKLFSQIF